MNNKTRKFRKTPHTYRKMFWVYVLVLFRLDKPFKIAPFSFKIYYFRWFRIVGDHPFEYDALDIYIHTYSNIHWFRIPSFNIWKARGKLHKYHLH